MLRAPSRPVAQAAQAAQAAQLAKGPGASRPTLSPHPQRRRRSGHDQLSLKPEARRQTGVRRDLPQAAGQARLAGKPALYSARAATCFTARASVSVLSPATRGTIRQRAFTGLC